jgi:Skp family chaperone for outer membrane proteins
MKKSMILCLLGGLLVSAQAGDKMIAAKLDTLPILQQHPEYQKLAEQYTKDNLELRKEIGQAVNAGKIPEQEAAKVYLERQDQLNKKWMDTSNKFIQERHETLRKAVAELCQEKGIDMVVVDSKVFHTVQYGAIDITQDVMWKLYGNPAQVNPTPGGTPK